MTNLVSEAGVGTVCVVPQLGILGVVTPGVTSSAMMIIIVLFNNNNDVNYINNTYCLLATSGLVRVPSAANAASTVGG